MNNINFKVYVKEIFLSSLDCPGFSLCQASLVLGAGLYSCNGYTSQGGTEGPSQRSAGLGLTVFTSLQCVNHGLLTAEGWIIRQNTMNKWMQWSRRQNLYRHNWGINLEPHKIPNTIYWTKLPSLWLVLGVIGPNLFVLFPAVLCHKISRRSSAVGRITAKKGSSNPIQGSEDSKYTQ